MFVLLPPSEAKNADDARRRSSPASTPTPAEAVSATRSQILTAVARLCTADETAAAAALSLPSREVAEACRRNAAVLSAPLLPALDRYCGVVYQGLDAASLPAVARAVAERSVVVFSGGFGIVRGGEGVPWYRIPASARLPTLGAVTSVWRPVLGSAVPELLGDELTVDLRSTDYQAMWKPARRSDCRLVAVRVLQRRQTGGGPVEQVVSYHSKLVKGRLVRALVTAAARRRRIDSADDVARVAVELGLLVRPHAEGLDLVDAG